MLIKGKDLLLYPNETRADAVCRVMKKYPEYFFDADSRRDHYTFAKQNGGSILDVRAADAFDSAVNTDQRNIMSVVRKIAPAPGREISVRHCYTPGGTGYFAVSVGERLRFVQSEYDLVALGTAWSFKEWRMIVSADALLQEYMARLKEVLNWRMAEKGLTLEMEIRHLYFRYITETEEYIASILKGDSPLPKKAADLMGSVRLEYKERYAAEDLGYGMNTRSAYNGDERNELYFFTNTVVTKAADDIYKKHAELEACGLWERAQKTIGKLNNAVYGKV